MSHNHGSTGTTTGSSSGASTTVDLADKVAYGLLYASQHEKHIMYAWIIWVLIAFVLGAGFILRLTKAHRQIPLASVSRRLFLKQTFPCTNWRMSVARGHVFALFLYIAYNFVFTFADIPYGRKYRYPSKHNGMMQTATTMQFTANRTGFLAFSGVPLVFLLAARNNLVSWATGIPYNALNFLHRWVGRVVFILSWLHIILWSLELDINYFPKGKHSYYNTRWTMRYWLGGFAATVFLCFLCLHSLPFVRRWTGYEFFRSMHVFGSLLFLIGCWVHWPTAFQWIAAGIAILFADHMARTSRMLFIQLRGRGSAEAVVGIFSDEDEVDVMRITIKNCGIKSWRAGQHVFLCFPAHSRFQAHPFTVANSSNKTHNPDGDLVFVVRRKNGMTDRLCQLAAESKTLKVWVDGPYGVGALSPEISGRHIQLVAGGTGISFALSAVSELTGRDIPGTMQLDWYVRRRANTAWFGNDLAKLSHLFGSTLRISIHITRESPLTASSTEKDTSNSSLTAIEGVTYSYDKNSCAEVLRMYASTVDPRQGTSKIAVLACGPGSMGPNVRNAVAEMNGSVDVKCVMEDYV
ncbi:hypothetical protein SAICODRAFT_7301 [Saitoella complicata NRRL Y-17804]|uniref:ferric-chelate reductase (NADPH) n=1 Tax=Saitoella complicata (strain BCRC 22490 / CBS 7301 / JCM 7358 / NBRC 10748 / NRRL Y-17804) TaxID=698492 RepID=A0A0E9N8Y8_SAICN|nr:uncharacterized protein SAICODRAFT_7301 [Saitoella complicata NRRL Y-17804]ODQ53144.1 hypothetical protein SAICODRAFT_7301 [Saitoella complicata NRRL Y-17804]GAO46268.1 hypothetical protein G7K_0502-t1 [Saitoella complicata NRRL Y-17804]